MIFGTVTKQTAIKVLLYEKMVGRGPGNNTQSNILNLVQGAFGRISSTQQDNFKIL
jgi:hypothetical protein